MYIYFAATPPVSDAAELGRSEIGKRSIAAYRSSEPKPSTLIKMLLRKVKTSFLVAFLLILSSIVGNGQAKRQTEDRLIVTPTKFKLQATNVSYQGEECTPSDPSDKVYGLSSEAIKIGNDIYYEGHRYWTYGRGEGMATENSSAKTCRIYRMSGLAKAAGWPRHADDDGYVPESTRGLHRVGNTLWMGSNAIGIAVFDVVRRTWSRYDVKSEVVPGAHVGVNYADDDYVFVSAGEFPGASMHIYSVKRDKWLGLKAVSTKLFSEFGYTTGMVQVPVDHRSLAKQKYFPIDWTVMYPKISSADNGESYVFVTEFPTSKTAYKITRSQLEQVFAGKQQTAVAVQREPQMLPP